MTAAAAWEDAGGALPSEIETALQSTNEEALRFFVHLTRSRRVSDGSKLCAISLWEARVCAGMYKVGRVRHRRRDTEAIMHATLSSGEKPQGVMKPELYPHAFHPVLKPSSRFTLKGVQHSTPSVMQTSGILRF
jgi:hypothetical protein